MDRQDLERNPSYDASPSPHIPDTWGTDETFHPHREHKGLTMSCERGLISALLLAVLCARSEVHAQVPGKALRTPPVPGKSLPIVPGSYRVTRSFPALGVETVVLRAAAAEKAQVVMLPGSRQITVSGIPQGGAEGYHPADPNWRETPAEQFGLDFQTKAFGPTLVISSSNEISYIHHHYDLDSIRIEVPQGVKVIKENRKLTGEKLPDLSGPIAR
jgi:hypothetical protein